MESILEWGVGVVIRLQGFHPWLDPPFKFVTFLGNEGFFLAFLPFLYWCFVLRLASAGFSPVSFQL